MKYQYNPTLDRLLLVAGYIEEGKKKKAAKAMDDMVDNMIEDASALSGDLAVLERMQSAAKAMDDMDMVDEDASKKSKKARPRPRPRPKRRPKRRLLEKAKAVARVPPPPNRRTRRRPVAQSRRDWHRCGRTMHN